MELVSRVRINNAQSDGQLVVYHERNQRGGKRVRPVDPARRFASTATGRQP